MNAPAAVGVLVPREVLRHRGAARSAKVDRAEAARDDEAGHQEERPAIVTRPVAVVDLQRREEVCALDGRGVRALRGGVVGAVQAPRLGGDRGRLLARQRFEFGALELRAPKDEVLAVLEKERRWYACFCCKTDESERIDREPVLMLAEAWQTAAMPVVSQACVRDSRRDCTRR